MQQFLFVVEVPPSTAQSSPAGYPPVWTEFANEADTILKSHKGWSKLQLNAWLLSPDNAWPALERLAAYATNQRLSYSIVLISGETTILAAAPAKP